MYGIILAGGSGSRLWPLSRELYPKQLIAINGEKSLLQSTCERIKTFVQDENIISVTNVKHANDVRFQLSKIASASKILAEPMGKNTAPAIASALEFIRQNSDKDEVVIIVPSDHLITNTPAFTQTVEKAKVLAEKGYIVTFGIKPAYPETGYGYVNVSEKLETGYKVARFVEKPDLQTAEKYLADGKYYWNGGMFMAKVSVLLEEIAHYNKEIFSNLKDFNFANGTPALQFGIYEKMPSISIDYAVMEKSSKIALVELESDWNDLGSWQSIYDIKDKDENGNVVEGNVITSNVKNSLLYSSKKLIAASGLEDVILVETEDAVMACKRESSQDVKSLYEKLKNENANVRMVHKTVFRPWGYYTCLADGEGYLTKVIGVSPKQKLSIQSHNHRSEHWVVLEGKALVLLDGVEHYLSAGQSIDIPLKAKHSLQNPYNEELRIIEVQKGDYISEDDIIRYEDAYGRV